jgi:hypothetical protein
VRLAAIGDKTKAKVARELGVRRENARLREENEILKMYGPPRVCKARASTNAVCTNVSGLLQVGCGCSQAMMKSARDVPNKLVRARSPFF